MYLFLNNVFDIIIIGIFKVCFLILIVYQHTNEFCLLNFYLAILLNSLMHFNSVSENPFGFSAYVIMPAANNDSFISSFRTLTPLFLFLVLLHPPGPLVQIKFKW